MLRCPVHDELYEKGDKCPRAGEGEHDCVKHTHPKEHEKERVLAAGGKWNDKTNKAVETDDSNGSTARSSGISL